MGSSRQLLATALLATALASAASAEALKDISIQSKGLAECRAGSRQDPQALGGYAVSRNDPQPIADPSLGTKGQIELVALPQDTLPFAGHYRGMRLLLVNRSGAEAVFPASDSRLAIVQEALDAQGQWQPIEVLGQSMCGNSAHRVFLPDGYCWEFSVPAYTGPLATRLRFHLESAGLISNEFAGSICPEQLESGPAIWPQPWSDLLKD